jgi:tetratricopeptide (TPR) repeat protein
MMKRLFIVILSCLSCSYGFAGEDLKNYEQRRKFDYFFLEALCLKEKNEYTDAYNALQYALKIDSTSSAALFELSHYYLFLKKDSLALDALQKTVKYSPDRFEYKLALADLNRKMRKFTESIAVYEELAGEYPGKPDIYFYLSDLYLRINQIDKAILALDDLENNLGINEAVSMQKYQLHNHLGKNEEAIREIEKLMAKFPMEAKYPIILGDFYLEKEDTVKALNYYDQAYRLDSDNPYYFVSMARYYAYQGNEDAETQEIDKALRNPSLDIETKLDILGKYIQKLRQTKKELESANALLETLLEQHSQEKGLNMIYGEFLLLQDKTEEARFQFQIVTEADPENIAAWRQLLTIALRADQTDEIISLSDGALVHFPEASEFYFYKGSAYYKKKEYTKALEILTQGLEVIPDDNRALLSNFYGQIGDLYYQMNEKEKAYQAYDTAVENNETNLLVLNNYAYFLSLDKRDLEKAERMSAKCVQLQPDNSTYIDTYAWIFFQKGSYSLAKFYIENALSKDKDHNGEIIEHYGDILYMTGNIDRAVAEWKKALELLTKEGEEENDLRVLQKKIKDRVYYEEE